MELFSYPEESLLYEVASEGLFVLLVVEGYSLF
jgi:hypothetical protein